MSGVSLIEVLIAAGIIALLVAVLFPAFKMVRTNSLKAACLNNLRQLGVGFALYAGENAGECPPESDSGSPPNGRGDQWDMRIMPYITFPTNSSGTRDTTSNRRTVYYCPASLPHPGQPRVRNLSYAYNRHIAENTHGSRRIQTMQNASRLLVLVDRQWVASPDESFLLGQGRNNGPVFVQSDNTSANFIPYARHGGVANILFADGSVASRPRVGSARATGTATNFPSGIFWHNQGTLTPE